jgi:hypothetical protein
MALSWPTASRWQKTVLRLQGSGLTLPSVEDVSGGVPTWMRAPDPRTVTPIAVAVMAAAAATKPLIQ